MIPPAPDTIVLHDPKNKSVLCSFANPTLTIVVESGRRASKIECPVNQVLWTEVTKNAQLSLSLLCRRKSGLALQKIVGTLDPSSRDGASNWARTLMDAAYEHRKRNCRFKVIINPIGGTGKSLSTFENNVKPIFEAANCILDVMVTQYHKHCYEYVKSMSLDCDAIVVLSGDGLVHEVFNAFADRDDTADAFQVPVVQIPTGSASGLSLCLLGLKDGQDVCAATLNAIKGRPMKMDLCSIEQEGKRFVSFMSQATGMMADVDLGTENMRWMGDSRFVVGFIREVGANKPCPVKLEVQIFAQDKESMIQTYRAKHLENGDGHPDALRSPKSDEEAWTAIDAPLVYIYAGKLPYVSRDLLQFPLAISDDRLIDVVAQEHCSRATLLKGMMSGAAEGKLYWNPTQRYYKARAYRITPLAKGGYVSIDGEKYPLAPFQVELYSQQGITFGDGGWKSEFSAI